MKKMLKMYTEKYCPKKIYLLGPNWEGAIFGTGEYSMSFSHAFGNWSQDQSEYANRTSKIKTLLTCAKRDFFSKILRQSH